MDISNNQIDLLYLTNPKIKIKYNKTNKEINLEDVKFYRKRILMDTKEYLRGKKINTELDNCFEEYASELIKYYKFIDKKNIIQEEYKSLPKRTIKKNITNLELINEDKKMMKKIEKEKKTIKDFLPIVVKEKIKKKIILPKKKNINLKDPKYRK